MEPVRTYTYLDKKEKMLGIEIIDFLILCLIYGIAFSISSNIILNLVIVVVSYLGLRLYKRNKPPQYTTMLFRFLFTPKYYTLKGSE